MTKTNNRYIKIEIESSNGSLVNITPFVNVVKIDEIEVYAPRPTIWQRISFILWSIWYEITG